MQQEHVRRTIMFDPKASIAKRGIALVYDLEGFSAFFNQPDMQDYVPKFINHVSQAVSQVIFGGEAYWLPFKNKSESALLAPVHEKYLGDGCLYIWSFSDDAPRELREFEVYLCNRLWNLKNRFEEVQKRSLIDVPVVELPKRIRFGLASGTIYELTTQKSRHTEYIGFCVNLASRLQKYCPPLGFIASARLAIPEKMLKEHGYIRVVATKLRGFPKEIVFVDKNEYAALEKPLRKELFAEI